MSAPRADLVLEGGGLKGLGGAGAVQLLLERGWTFPRVCGSSAGAVLGCFVAAGADPEQLGSLVERLDYGQVPDRVPGLDPVAAVLAGGGVHHGAHLRDWVGDELAGLGVVTFADLRRTDPADDDRVPARDRWSFVATALEVTRGRRLRLPWDYPSLGVDPDEALVADAVRASAAIPLYFEPVRVRHPGTGEVAVLVDGGLVESFPLAVFDRTDAGPPRWPTLGVSTTGRGLADPARTIAVDTSAVGVVELGATPAQRAEVTANGRRAAEAFLAGLRPGGRP